jgi:cell division protein FtsZ
VINEDLGDRIKITAIATGFGSTFEKGKRPVEEQKMRSQAVLEKVDRDLPTFIRDRQKESPRMGRTMVVDEDQYDIPTFLRKRVD